MAAPDSELSPNFEFLSAEDVLLAKMPTQAEQYLHDDPVASLMKLRQFGELLAEAIAARSGLPAEYEKQVDLLVALKSIRIVPESEMRAFHKLRTFGNDAMHSRRGSEYEAMQCIKAAWHLGIWFHRTFHKPGFKAQAFVPPARPIDRTAELRKQKETIKNAADKTAFELNEAKVGEARAREERDASLSLAEQIDRELADEREQFSASLIELRKSLGQILPHQLEEIRTKGALAAVDLRESIDHDRPGVWVEQRSHLNNFVGRAEELKSIRTWAETGDKGGYLVVLGNPGQGKSALLAKIAEIDSINARLAAPDTVQPVATLLHMSKSGVDSRQMMQFLLWQAATVAGDTPLASHYAGSLIQLRDRLFVELGKLAAARGSVLLVIDALDELVGDHQQPARELVFLPDNLPGGVRVVLSSRPIDALVSHLQRRLPTLKTIALGPLTEGDVSTYLAHRLLPEAHQWLIETAGAREILERTSGAPLLLRRVADVAKERFSGMDYAVTGKHAAADTSWIPQSVGEVFADIYREIREPPKGWRRRGQAIREAVVHLLSCTYEPFGIAELVDSMHVLRVRADSQQVRDAVEGMSAYLIDIGAHTYRLYHQGLADYARDRLGADGRARVHRALMGSSLRNVTDVEARLVTHIQHGLDWHSAASEANDAEEAQAAAAAVARVLTDYEAMETAVDRGLIYSVIPLMDRAVRGCSTDLEAETAQALVEWVQFVNAELAVFAGRPGLFFQQALNTSLKTVRNTAMRQRPASMPYFRRVVGPSHRAISGAIRPFPNSSGVEGFDRIAVCDRADTMALLRHDDEWIGLWRISSGEELWNIKPRFGMHGGRLALCEQYVAVSCYGYKFPNDEAGEDGADPIATVGDVALRNTADGTENWMSWRAFGGRVLALAFSPDSRLLYVGAGEDADMINGDLGKGSLTVLDVGSGEVVRRMTDFAPVRSILASTDGRYIVSGGGYDGSSRSARKTLGELRIWDAKTLELIQSLDDTAQPVVSIVALDDESFIAAQHDGTIGVWNWNGELIRAFTTELPRTERIGVAAGGEMLCIGSRPVFPAPARVDCWNLRTNRNLGMLHHPGRGYDGFGTTHTENDLLLADESSVSLIRIDAALAASVLEVQTSNPRRTIVSYSPDLRAGAARLRDDVLSIIDLQTGRTLADIVATDPVALRLDLKRGDLVVHKQVVTLSDGGRYAAVSNPSIVDLLTTFSMEDTETGASGFLILGRAAVDDVAFSSGGRIVAILSHRANEGRFGRTLSARLKEFSKTERDTISRVVEELTSLREATNRSEKVTLGPQPRLTLFPDGLAERLTQGSRSVITSINLHRKEIVASIDLESRGGKVHLSGDGRFVALLRVDGVKIWKLGQSDPIVELTNPNPVSSIVWMTDSPDRVREGIAKETDDELKRDFKAETVTFSPDGRLVMIGGTIRYWISIARRWNLETGEEIEVLPTGPGPHSAISMDGRVLFSGFVSGIGAHEMQHGKEIAFWPTIGAPNALAVRDEGRIAFADGSGEITVLELIES